MLLFVRFDLIVAVNYFVLIDLLVSVSPDHLMIPPGHFLKQIVLKLG